MNDSVSAFVTRYNEAVEEAANFRFITRSSELQKQACEKVFLASIASEKEQAAIAGNEDYANLLLACECAVEGLVAELRMWLLLKQDQPDKAWDHLVTAQNALASALKAHDGFTEIDNNLRRLDAIERIIFPPQVFFSSGMIVDKQICSICSSDYEDCEHVKGRPYMGKFCMVRLIASKVDHVAMVHNPADKRCRVEKFSEEGGYRNRMTWAIELSGGPEDAPLEGFHVQGTIAKISEIDEGTGSIAMND
jgi:hypothetical protein